MDYIHIEEMVFQGKHGVYPREREVEQDFAVSLRLSVDTSVSGRSDSLQDTVDYDWVKRQVQEVFQGNSRYLVERLAEDVLQRLFTDKRIAAGEITIKKTGVWENGIPGVTVTRANS